MRQNGSAAAPARTERRETVSDMTRSSTVEAINVTGSGSIDHAFGKIACDRRAIAFGRRPIAARARRDHLEPVAGLELGGIAIERDARPRDHAATRPRLPPEQAPGVLAQARNIDAHAAIGRGAINARQSHPAAEFSRPAGAVDQFVT